MEWIGNWYLTYRTGRELQRLAYAAEIPKDRLQVSSEALGVDMFLIARN